MSGSPTAHQLKISLAGAAPPLWRRVQIPSDASLGLLHHVIQEAFGWEGFHLHRFTDERNREWGDTGFDEGGGFAEEEDAELGKVMRSEGAVLQYEYDFGDSWQHRIELEKVVPLDPGAEYPRCTGGRRAAPPAEDIGGIWGLREIVHLVTHPESKPPEHWEDLVSHLRENGWDPAAFDPAELSGRLSRLVISSGGTSSASSAPARGDIFDDDGDFFDVDEDFEDDEPVEPEVFPVVTLAPPAELAAQARQVPLIRDALALAAWCAPGRPVTAKGVLKPALAKEAVTELRLWGGDDTVISAKDREEILTRLRSASNHEPLHVPWQFAAERGLIAIRSGNAVPGPELPGPGNDEELLATWREALADEVRALDAMGGHLMPGMMRMLAQDWDSVIIDVLAALYRVPDGEWLDSGALLSSPGAATDPSGATLQDAFVVQSTSRLLTVLSDFGAVDVDWGTIKRSAVDTVATTFVTGTQLPLPVYRMRLTPLGRYGVRGVLADTGHVVPVAGDLARADAATLLDSVSHYDPASLLTEINGWLAARDEESAVTELLAAVPGTDPDPDRATLRYTAIAVLSMAKPDSGRRILREAAATGPDGTRHVAAGALANLGEETPGYSDGTAQWLLIDLLTTMPADDLREFLTPELVSSIRSQADVLWRCEHGATADALETAAEAIRDTDKKLAKQLRLSAYKARHRG